MLAHLLSVLCLTAVKASEAKIIFRKSLSTEIPFLYAAGNPINVTLDIYNLGTGSAYNLKASDAWPRDYFDIEGEMEAEFDEVQASGHKQHNFTVTPKFDATPEKPLLYVRGFPAELIFSTDEAGEDRTHAISTQMRDILVRSAEEYKRLTAKHNMEWAIFSIGMVASVLVPFVTWLYFSNLKGVPPSKPKKE
ncbi:hypothetical protein AAMO2058_000631100 [Amorphochlora amoebiformis]